MGGEAVCEEAALHAGVCQEDLWVPQFGGVQTPPRYEPLHLEKTRPSLLQEAVFPPALS